MATDDAGIILVSNPSTEFANILLYNADICNNWLDSCCIIFGEILRIKIMRALT